MLQRLVPAAAVLLVLPVLVPCWFVVLPRLSFDVDPRTPGADVVTTLGPAAFAWLACFGVLASALAVALHAALGGAVRWGSSALVLLGVAAAAWHAPDTFTDRWHGVGWGWAGSAGLAAAHLGQHAAARRWATMLLAGLAGALAVEAVYYVFVEHPEMVRQFERHRDELLAARGWEPGSSEATLYERRLRTDDAVGAFGLSNVLGTLAAGLSVMGLGLAAAGPRRVWVSKAESWRLWRAGGWKPWCVGLLVFLLSFGTVWFTNSAAALVALLLGIGWISCSMVVKYWKHRQSSTRHHGRKRPDANRAGPRLLSAAAVGLVALVFVAVFVRGAMGPPTPEHIGQGLVGERSVLFRFHYWQAAASMVLDALRTDGILAVLAGVGAEEFGSRYLIHKNPLNPEEVSNAHAAFVDYTVMLGVGGLAWSVVLLAWLWRGATSVLRDTPAGDATDQHSWPARPAFYATLLAAVVLFVGEAVVALPEISGLGPVAMRLMAAAFFVGIALAWGRFASDAARRLGVVGGAVAVLVHGQFDMGFFQPASAPVFWVMLGLCGAGVAPARDEQAEDATDATASDTRTGGVRWVVVALLLVATAWSAASAARLTRYQALTGEAADRARAGQLLDAATLTQRASDTVGVDRSTFTATVRLRHEAALAAAQRGGRLTAFELWGAADWLGWHRPDHNDGRTVPERRAWAWRLVSELERAEAEFAPADELTRRLSYAIETRRRAASLSPFSLSDAVSMVEAWQAMPGRAVDEGASLERAQQWARKALELDAQRYLDPGKQLDDATRERMQAIVDAAE